MQTKNDGLGFWRGAVTAIALSSPFWLWLLYAIVRAL